MDGDRIFAAPKRGVRPSEAKLAGSASRRLAPYVRAHRDVTVRLRAGKSPDRAVTLPAPALRALQETLNEIAKGNAVRVVAAPSEYSVEQAAAILGMTRDALMEELEAGRLPYRLAGRQRRIGAEALEAYRRRSLRRRRRSLDALTALSQRLKLEY